MRTKALLCLAALAAGAVSVMAQSNVYSLNVVGYVNVPVEANQFYCWGNPLEGASGNITNTLFLTDAFDGTVVYPWTAGGYGSPDGYYAGYGWYPGVTDLTPGNGFFFVPSTSATITFVGQVVMNSTNALPPGYTMTSSAFPAATDLATLGLNPSDGDTMYRWVGGTFSQPIGYYAGYGWWDSSLDDGGPVNGPTLNVGEGFFYDNGTSTTEQWVQNFTIQ